MATWKAFLAEKITKADAASSVLVRVWYYDADDPLNAGAGLAAAKTGTATASTDLVNITNHGYAAGQQVRVTALTGGAGLAVSETYYVLAAGLTTNAFQVSRNGTTPVDITSNATSITVARVIPPTVILHVKDFVFAASQVELLSAQERQDALIDLVQAEGDRARRTADVAAQLALQFPIGATLVIA